MAYPTRSEADRHWFGYGRVIWALGRTHPERIPLYCRLLAEVARIVTGDEKQDGWTVNNVVHLAVQLERPGNDCFAQVRAVMPDTEAVRHSFQQSTPFCWPDARACQRLMDRDNLR